jgi:hypothetical protein
LNSSSNTCFEGVVIAFLELTRKNVSDSNFKNNTVSVPAVLAGKFSGHCFFGFCNVVNSHGNIEIFSLEPFSTADFWFSAFIGNEVN